MAAEQKAIWKYEHMRDSLLRAYKQQYMQKCYENLKENEEFLADYQLNRHSVTLYYYDQAGNLMQTIPPAGVQKITDGQDLTDVISYRISGFGTPTYPSHTMATYYHFSTLNQVVLQKSPDADTSRYWYDPANRIILSQNGDQKDSTAYSYTFYDALGRPTEAGRVEGEGYFDTNPFSFITYEDFYDTIVQLTRTAG